jgi:hypothetical protein
VRRRETGRMLPPVPPPELMQPVWLHHPTYAARLAAFDRWCAARAAWLAGFGWSEEELSDDIAMGRPLPEYLVEFDRAGGSAPFDPDNL